VAECEPTSARLLALKLRHVGPHEMLLATSGDEALGLFERHEPDLIFLCLHLPVLSGYEVLAQIRASRSLRRDVPIVALETCAMASEMATAVAKGFDAVLPRGGVLELQKMVAALLARSRTPGLVGDG
jgi:CheY-like chemotaxis protein